MKGCLAFEPLFVLDWEADHEGFARCAARGPTVAPTTERPDGAGREVVEGCGGACHNDIVSIADRRTVPGEASGPEAAGR